MAQERDRRFESVTAGLAAPVLVLALALAGACAPSPEVPPEAPSGASPAEGADAGPPAVAAPTGSPDLWPKALPPEDLPRDRPLRVAFLIVDGVYNTELVAPFDVFHHVQFHTDPGMEVFTVSPGGEPVKTFEGLRIEADYSLEEAPEVDVLVVPSAEHSMDTDLENRAMIEWVAKTGAEAFFVLSLCDGAFVLAEAGLLDGRAATTFPSDQDRFAEMFPQVDLSRGVSFVHDDAAVTSEGGARSFDPAMYLVDLIYGEAVAQGVGRGLLIPWPPAPGSVAARIVVP